MVDIQSPTAEKRRGKKKKDRNRSCKTRFASATQDGRNKRTRKRSN